MTITVGHCCGIAKYVESVTRCLSHVQTEVHRGGSRDGWESQHDAPWVVIFRRVRKSKLVHVVSLVIGGVVEPGALVNSVDNTDEKWVVAVGVEFLEDRRDNSCDDGGEKVSDTYSEEDSD